jgi:hypothetical protein
MKLVIDGGVDAIKRVTKFFTGAVDTALSVPNTGERHRRKRTTKFGKKGSQYTTYPNVSAPGDPPHKRKGHLRGGVVFEIAADGLSSRVGILKNVIYGLYLEFGTKKMAARPWLLATLKKVMPQLKVLGEQ